MVGNPGVAAMVEHHALLYADLADPVALLRGEARRRRPRRATGPMPRRRDPRALAPEQVAAYTALMAASQPLRRRRVLAAYDSRRHRCLLDLGGGDGSFLRRGGGARTAISA